MSILAWIVIGGVAGWLASIIMGNNASMGIVANVIFGIIGAFVGGFLFSLLGGAGLTGFNLYSLLVATLGAVVTLSVIRLVNGHA